MNNGGSFFGSDWLGAFLIIAILFGGGLGWGGNRAPGPMPDVATKEYVMDTVNNQAIQSGIQQILLSSANNNYETAQRINDQTTEMLTLNGQNQLMWMNGFNNIGQTLQGGFATIGQKIDQLGYQMESCCCSIKTQMLQDKYDALEQKYRDAQNDISNDAQSRYILGALGRFVAYPPAAATAAAGG